jgi:class 3 adenylate cyclase/tetratricopeptide (TPR) repeat protein
VGEKPAAQPGTADHGPENREAARDLAERRHVTVLFCDLVGSTELATELDPEDLRRVMRAYQAAGVSVIARFDGHVAQYLGDGLLVYFGYPTAHEDDAERAIRAGLGILEAIGRVNPDLERGHGVRLAARIGIHTGLVVAGEVGAGGRLERLALGGAPNVAARLKDVAMPDTVVISEETHRLVDGYFDMRSLGIHQLRGTGQATPVHQVVRERVARTRLDAAGSAALTPLAGRDVEVRQLLDRWEKVKNGHGQVVLLGGEAGIGKSRLVRVMQEHVAADPNAWLTTCQASSYARNTAFHPIIDLLERVVLQFEPDEGAEAKLRKVEGWLVQSGLAPAETLPLMAGLLSLPPDPRHPAHLHDPEREKLKTKETLLRALLARASERPVLFVLEDLHWADPSTIELMDLLVKSLADARILVVLTFRTEYVPPWAPRDDLTSLTLNRLERDPSALIAAWAAGAAALPEALLQQVLARADGNPLFIEELSKLLRESGLVRQAEQSGSLPQLTIPATLRGSLAARLDRLGGAKTVAQIGAVLGREFSYDILRAVCELDGPALDGALGQLVNAEMLFQSGQPPSARYLFKHALIQEAAYDAILKSTRQNQHRRIAEVLTERFQHLIDKQPELIAHHYSEAGLHEKAVPYWQKAGQHALARAANQEAIAHLERALRQASSLPEGASRDKLELELQNGLAPAYMAIKGWASLEVERTCRRARTLAELLGDFPSTYGSQWGLWTNYFLRGRLDEAIDTGKQVLQLAEKAGIPMLEVMACHAVAYSYFYRGEFLEARATAERGLRLFSLETEREMTLNYQFSSSAALRIILGCSQWMLGYPEQAPPIVASGVALTRELAHHPSHAYALAASLLLHAYRLDIEETARTAEDLFRLAKQENFEIWTPFARMFRGWVLVERGEHDQGLQETRRGIKMWQETGSYLNQTIAMAMLGLSQWKAGRPDEALATLENEVFEAEGRAELHFAPELHRLKGEILLERAMLAESEASFERARAVAHQQSARMLELRAATSLGRLWLRTGRAEAARQMVADLLAGFTEGYATPDLTAARALLDELGTGHEPAARGARSSG